MTRPPRTPDARPAASAEGRRRAGAARRWVPALAAAALAAAGGAAPASAAWGPPEAASLGVHARQPDVAMNARGDAGMAWVGRVGGRPAVVAAARAAGGRWERPRRISPAGAAAIDPSVAVSAAGALVVTWRQVVRRRVVRTERGRRRRAVHEVRARRRELPGRRWGPVASLSDRRHAAGAPALAADDRGEAVAAWSWGTGTSFRSPGYVRVVRLAGMTPDGRWSRPRTVSRSRWCREVGPPRVAAAGAGHAAAWWPCRVRGGTTAMAVTRAPGAGWAPERELPLRTRGPQRADLAVARGGGLVAAGAAGDGRLRWWRGRIVPAGIRLTGLAAPPGAGGLARRSGRPSVAVNGRREALAAWVDRSGRPRAAPAAASLGVAPATVLRGPRPASAPRGGLADSRRGVVAWVASGRVLAVARGAAGEFSSTRPVSRRGRIGAADSPRVALDARGDAIIAWSRGTGGRRVVERAELVHDGG